MFNYCSTGQKYIYTGSNDGAVYTYDLVSIACILVSRAWEISSEAVMSWASYKNGVKNNESFSGIQDVLRAL